MKHSKIEGYAIIKKDWLGKGHEVIGIGQRTCEAWADAGESQLGGRIPTRDLYKECQKWKCVPATIKIAYEVSK